jgi:hypothetical protein
MTSPLRRKRQITLLNTAAPKACDAAACATAGSPSSAAMGATAGLSSSAIRTAYSVATGLFVFVALGAMSAATLADDGLTHLQWRPYRPERPTQRVAVDSSVRQASDEEPIDNASGTPRITARRLEADMDVAQTQPKSNNSLFDPFGDKTNPTAPPADISQPATPKNTPAKKDPFTDDAGAPALPITPSQPVAPAQQAPPATLPAQTAPVAPAEQPAPPVRATPLPDNDPNLKFRQTPAPPAEITPNVPQFSCGPNQKSCDDELEALYKHTIDKVSLDITEKGTPGNEYPCECGMGNLKFEPRQWDCITYTWKASALCHKPLYFEEQYLERNGHSRGPIADPLVSAAHFFITVPLLPYYMGVELPHECEYSLGYYRPGSCAPWIIDGFPLSCRGAAFEATAVTGTAFLLP